MEKYQFTLVSVLRIAISVQKAGVEGVRAYFVVAYLHGTTG